MNQHRDHAIGIDLGGTDIKAARVSSKGEIQARSKRPTLPDSGPDGIADTIVEMVRELGDEPSGVGIGVPGVTTTDGVVVIAPNLSWMNVPFKAILQDRLDGPVEIDNDANVAALGEARAGVGAGCETFVLITLGTGIGGGIVLNGKIHHGASHSAGEIGHMGIIPDGPECGCGSLGCLEPLTSGPALVRLVKAGLAQDRTSSVTDNGSLTPESIWKAALAGDVLCQEATDRMTRYLGLAVANLINILSPNVIAFGGGISGVGKPLIEAVSRQALPSTLSGMFDHTRIELATLRNDAGALGAAFLILQG